MTQEKCRDLLKTFINNDNKFCANDLLDKGNFHINTVHYYQPLSCYANIWFMGRALVLSKKGIGGLKRFLFGKLAMTYWIYDRDYEAKISIQEGTIEIEENAKFINDIETQLEKYWNSLSKEEWESFTYESIEELIKKALKKTNRKKEEAKDEV